VTKSDVANSPPKNHLFLQEMQHVQYVFNGTFGA
jgi:hypothetical protein